MRRIASLHVSHPFVSLDGKWIFARSRNFIYRIPAAGGAPEMLTDQGGAPMMESRDGRYLYFGGGRMDTTVMRLDLQTRKQELVIRSLIPGYRDCWTITADGILFLTEEAGKPVIEYRNLTTRAERKIADFPGPLPPVATSGFSLSPDGRRLLIVRAEPAFAGLQTESFTPAENAGQ